MHFKNVLLICQFAIIIACPRPHNNYILSLNSDNEDGEWVVQNDSENGIITTTAIVPGGIYSDLRRAELIPDILYKFGDVTNRWVSQEIWMYSKNFTVSYEILQKNTINLVFHGLDTIATIFLNNELIGKTDNMFIKYSFDVKQHLVEGNNHIQVRFDSSIKIAKDRSEEELILPECVPDIYNGECHVNQLRKMQASFSWDWGPGFPSMGIWKPVNLESYNSAIITDITTNTIFNPSESIWHLTLQVYMDVSEKNSILEGHLVATLETNHNGSLSVYKLIKEDMKGMKNIQKEINMTITPEQVTTWWPNGYGDQNLYSLKVTFQSIKYPDELFYKDIKIAFRTIELIQQPITLKWRDEGLSFYLKINDLPIFMKGTNWIPADILPEKGYDEKKVDYLLQSAKDIHVNMMRVWGGGVYESDYFYQKCDEMGILIWQDFMFACSMYPANKNFLSSVAEEVKQVVRRLQHHPSIALWAGNNENEIALRSNWYGTSNNFTRYKDDYIKLYVDTMRPIVRQNDPTRTYLISSPSNGIQSEIEGYIANNPGDPCYGDTHYYNYIQDLWSMDTYPKTRFSSEYGFQSVPSIDTLKTATDDPADLQIDSKFMQHRQHSPNGYETIMNQIKRHLPLPEKTDPNFFSTFIYFSQINQAMAMKTETEFYRQSQHDWMTMGALYWQLNDVWQAPSWSSIEHSGRWKIMHYFAKNFFSPILVSPRLLMNNELYVFIINNKFAPIINATMSIDTFSWDNLEPISTKKTQVDVKGLLIKEIVPDIDVPRKSEKTKLFYRFTLKNENSDSISPENYIFPAPLKDIIGFIKPNIEVNIIEMDNKLHETTPYKLSIKTDGIVLFLWLEMAHSDGWFSDNGFILTEPTKEVIFYSRQPIHKKDFSERLTVQTLYDTRVKIRS